MRAFRGSRSARFSHARALALVSILGATAVIAAAEAHATSLGTAPFVAPTKCGQDVVFKHSGAAFNSLSPTAQKLYAPYPYSVNSTPWSNFKGKKGPWKIGFINFPVDNPWQVKLLSQLKAEFGKAKAKGLVTGSLQTYIQPSFATATPEQQDAAIQQMVRNGVSGILIHPLNAIAETPAIDAAGKAGVPVVLTSDVAPNSNYAINVFAQNNSPTYAGTLALMVKHGLIGKGKTVNVLMVRGIPGVTVEQAFYNAAVADLKACPGVNIVGTIWGQWNAATAKTEILKFLASHPQKIDLVFQSAVGGGVISAFQAAGRPVPVMNFGGASGGDLSWWAANKNTTAMTNAVGGQFGGFQVAYTTFRILLRVLGGNGLKVRDIHIPASITTNANIDKFASPGKPLTWIGDIRGPLDGWGSDSLLEDYFAKPGSPGGI